MYLYRHRYTYTQTITIYQIILSGERSFKTGADAGARRSRVQVQKFHFLWRKEEELTMNLIHVLANSFGPEVLPSQVMKVSWSLVMPRRQRLQDFFSFFPFLWRMEGGRDRERSGMTCLSESCHQAKWSVGDSQHRLAGD